MNRVTLLEAGLLAAALLAAGTTAAVAGPQQPAVAPKAETAQRDKLDANGDGAIDRTEAAASQRLAGRFDQLDRNGDGRLAADERPQHGGHGKRGHHRGGPGGRGIEGLDKDSDGRISRAEFDAGQAAREARMRERGGESARKGKPAFDFAAADANRDGQLVRGELRAYHERTRPQREAEFAKRSAERFAAADINKDGRLSKLEVGEKLPRMEASFAWMDENRDGFLSREELQPPRRR